MKKHLKPILLFLTGILAVVAYFFRKSPVQSDSAVEDLFDVEKSRLNKEKSQLEKEAAEVENKEYTDEEIERKYNK